MCHIGVLVVSLAVIKCSPYNAILVVVFCYLLSAGFVYANSHGNLSLDSFLLALHFLVSVTFTMR